jgi:hypothetical protein
MALLLILLGTMVIASPMGVIVNRFLPDDAFYYFKPAQVFATTGFISFDGIHPTNGFHFLWFAVCVPVFWLFPQGGEVPVRILLMLQLVMGTVGSLYLLRGLRASLGSLPSWVAMLLWVFVFYQFSTNGLSTGLLVLCYGFTFDYYIRRFLLATDPIPVSQFAILGIALSLCFLCRSDMAFLVAGLAFSILIQHRKQFHGLLAFALPLSLLCGGYLLWNLVSTGHLMQVSGAAKQYHSSLTRDAAIEREGNYIAVLWENLTWPFRLNNRVIRYGLLGPWLLFAISFVHRKSTTLMRVRGLWPFYLATTLSWLFYGISFHGNFSWTAWYYLPMSFMAAFSIAAIVALLNELRAGLGLIPGLILVIHATRIVGVPSAHIWILIAAAILLAGLAPKMAPLLRRIPARERSLSVLTIVLAVLPWITGIASTLACFYSTCAVLALATLRSSDFASIKDASMVGFALFLAWAPPLIHQRRADVLAEPVRWNHHLYQGALWAKHNLPEEATVWSGSTGILGYFSERTCVNTDGLINSYDFLENVLKKGKLLEFYRKWDYSIDAMPDEALLTLFPQGEFVRLAPEYDLPAFADGKLQRKLRVFRMKKD